MFTVQFTCLLLKLSNRGMKTDLRWLIIVLTLKRSWGNDANEVAPVLMLLNFVPKRNSRLKWCGYDSLHSLSQGR